MIKFDYSKPAQALLNRKLLNLPIAAFHQAAIQAVEKKSSKPTEWAIHLSDTLYSF